MSLHKTEAIILRRRHFGDTSLIFTFYTRDYGKLDALAKGIKKGIARGGGGLEIGSQVELVYYEKEPRTLRLVNHLYLLNSFAYLRLDILKLAYASYLVEAVDKLIHGEEKNENIYRLLLTTLAVMENEKDLKRLVHFFEIRLITLLGYGPYLTSCSRCHKKALGQFPLFIPSRGGVLCAGCGRGGGAAERTSALRMCPEEARDGIILRKISLWQFLEKADYRTISRLKMSEADEKELKTVLQAYLQTLLADKTLRTQKVIEKLEKN